MLSVNISRSFCLSSDVNVRREDKRAKTFRNIFNYFRMSCKHCNFESFRSDFTIISREGGLNNLDLFPQKENQNMIGAFLLAHRSSIWNVKPSYVVSLRGPDFINDVNLQ